MNLPAQRRLKEFFGQIGQVLKNVAQKASFATYAMGLLGEGERKSIEPIAARACGDRVQEVDALHQRLLHFIGPANWSDRQVRLTAARYAIKALEQRGPIESTIIDDTGFLKQGEHSVGVKRQYTGSAGKVANCQVVVTVTQATSTDHAPIDMQLYLPDTWANDPERRKEGHIPDEVVFQTKPQIAVSMLQQARADGLPLGRVLADCGYGDNDKFRQGVRDLELDFAVGIQGDTKIYGLKGQLQHPQSIQAVQWAKSLKQSQYRPVEWRDGTHKKLCSHFVVRRAVVHGDPRQEPVWVVFERPPDQPHKLKFHLVTGPKTLRRKELIRLVKERYRTEQMYEETKGGLGLDHYEGRRYRGWNHHISVVLSCYAFVIAERVQHFPPSATRTRQAGAQRLAA